MFRTLLSIVAISCLLCAFPAAETNAPATAFCTKFLRFIDFSPAVKT